MTLRRFLLACCIARSAMLGLARAQAAAISGK